MPSPPTPPITPFQLMRALLAIAREFAERPLTAEELRETEQRDVEERTPPLTYDPLHREIL